ASVQFFSWESRSTKLPTHRADSRRVLRLPVVSSLCLHPLTFADIEGEALSHAKLLRSLRAKGLEPPGIGSQIQLFIHWHLQAASSVHCQGHARLGADRTTAGGDTERAV